MRAKKPTRSAREHESDANSGDGAPIQERRCAIFHSLWPWKGFRSRTISIARSTSPDYWSRLFVLIKLAKERRKAATGVAGRGAPVGIRGYPGLSWLVYFLERSAHAAGGGFTVNKRDRKGSLLDALDLLRVHLLACPDLKPLANLIPLPSQHPCATYQRAISRARRQPSTNAQRWSAWKRVKIAPPILGAS